MTKLRIPDVAHVLAVASGKGGVGKTTVSVNLALALAATGARVGLFDADIYGPNVPLMLGVHRQHSARGLLPIARAESTPYIPPLKRYGLSVMSIGLLVGEDDAVMPDPHDAGRIVTQTLRDVAWGALDYLLIDLPPGTGEPQHSLVRQFQIDGAVVVTTPQDLSLLDASRSLGLFRVARVPILGVIENMSYMLMPDGSKLDVFGHGGGRQLARDTGVEFLGEVPLDPQVRVGGDGGVPVVVSHPESAVALSFEALARLVFDRADAEPDDGPVTISEI